MSEAKDSISELLEGKKLIIASNRGPVSFVKDEAGRLRAKRGAGGLVTAMSFVLEAAKATWIACPISETDRDYAMQNKSIPMPANDPNYWLRFVRVDRPTYDLYYNEVSNKLLWFALHYLWDLVHEPILGEDIIRAWDEGYLAVNRAMAETIALEGKPLEGSAERPIVMIHDYHLLTCGYEVKKLMPDTVVTFFQHVPWPQADYLRVLPEKIRDDIFKGLLACDLIGFHTEQYGENFLNCCRQFIDCEIDWDNKIVRLDGREIKVRAYPISIQPDQLRRYARDTEVSEWVDRLRGKYDSQSLVVRVDRVEPTKNAVRGFRAFDLMLERHPELLGKVKFLACMYPSRDSLSVYRNYLDEVSRVAEEVNKKHGNDSWRPISLEIEDNYPRSTAALRIYDVLLVNSIADGMNLVAKEGPVLNERSGTLVLSGNSGAFNELGDGAIIVNPFDVSETAEALYQAVTMPESERKLRAERLANVMEENDSLKWLYHQLCDADKL